MIDRNIITLNIDQIKPYKKNAKKHPKSQIEQIKASILQFGMNDPLGVWGKDNLIVEGHGRYEACKQLGIKDIPCIRLDHMTDEERKAYTLVHNKLTMNSDFDLDLLTDELSDILDIDMSVFDFDMQEALDELEELEIKHQEEKETTQDRKSNILNLEIAQYAGVGKYDIPPLYPIHKKDIGEVKEWISFNYVMSDKNPQGKGVHFFIDDYQFVRIWNDPLKYIDKLSQYEAVMAPDFSPYGDMPLATQIFNHYRKHWIARLWQENGIKVIPVIRASTDERSLSWYLDGEPTNSVICISNMWTSSANVKDIFKKEFEKMKEKLKPEHIIVYGHEMAELENVEYIKSFAESRWNQG